MNETLEIICQKTKATSTGENKWQGHCPVHKDSTASLTITLANDGKILLHCHAKCNKEDICKKLGLELKDLFTKKTSQKKVINKIYDYCDESGTLLFQSVRYIPKKFEQRRPDGKRDWIWNLKGIRRVLYRLPELLKADPSQLVFIPEGEKDVDRLGSLGLIATCNPMGAGKWSKVAEEARKILTDRVIVILPDNDNPGRKHAQEVARSLVGYAKSIKVLSLPGLPDKGDVSDWLDAGGTVVELQRLVSEGEEWKPGTANTGTTAESEEVLAGENWNPAWPYLEKDDPLGIYWEKPDKKNPIKMCNFTAHIIEELIYDDGSKKKTKQYRIVGKEPGGNLYEVIVKAEDFDSLKWVGKDLSAEAYIEPYNGNKDHLCVAIKKLSGKIPKQTIYTFIGWKEINGDFVYLHAGGGISRMGSVNGVSVELDGKLGFYRFEKIPQGKELKTAILSALKFLKLAPLKITYPCLAAIFRAPMREADLVDYLLHIVGETGKFKSAMQAVMQSFYGSEFDDRNFPSNWPHDTVTSREMKAYHAKDAIFSIDDYKPGLKTKEKLETEAEKFITSIGNGESRGRCFADCKSQQEYPPRCLPVSSGEISFEGQSNRARVLFLEIAPGDVKETVLNDMQVLAQSGVLSSCMAAFLKWLAPKMCELKKSLPEKRYKIRVELWNKIGHARTPDYMASLFTGFEKFIQFAIESNGITEEEGKKYIENWNPVTENLFRDQEEYLKDEDPINRFFELLKAAFARKDCFLILPNGGIPPNPRLWGWDEIDIGRNETKWDHQGKFVGYILPDGIGLSISCIMPVIQTLGFLQDKKIPIGSTTLFKRMKDNKKIIPDKGQTTKNIKINKKGTRLIFIPVEVLLEEEFVYLKNNEIIGLNKEDLEKNESEEIEEMVF